MRAYHVSDLKEFEAQSFNKKELHVTKQSKVILICFEAGQAVDPCIMSRHTLFYIIEGEGMVKEEKHGVDLAAGSLVLIKPELERQIIAKTRMVVLAVQYS